MDKALSRRRTGEAITTHKTPSWANPPPSPDRPNLRLTFDPTRVLTPASPEPRFFTLTQLSSNLTETWALTSTHPLLGHLVRRVRCGALASVPPPP